MTLVRKYSNPLVWFTVLVLSAFISGCGSSGRVNDIIGGVAPTVISTNPVDAATDVVRNRNVIANFSTAMNGATITTSTFTLTKAGTTVLGGVSYAGTTATFNPAVDLDANTTYTATITTGAKNEAGTALAANHVWTFTTGTTIDSTAPTVLSTNPVDNNTTTGVAIDQNITALFSEALDPTTVTAATFTVTGPGATPVDGNVSYAGTTATFNPTSNLAPSTLYTATLTTGITDLAANPLAANHVWTFTTGTGVLPANPTAPVLGEAGRFVLLARAEISTTGATAISNGDIGITPAARSFFHGFTASGAAGDFTQLTGLTWVGMASTSYAPDDANPNPFPYPLHYAAPHAVYATSSAMLTQSSTDWGVAAVFLAADPNPGAPTQVCPTELGTQVLTRGVYKTASNVTISTGPLHLDAQGDPTAVFIFNIGGTLTAGASGSIILDNGALAKNVYWRTAGITYIAGTIFKGNVFSSSDVQVLDGANITGSLFAETKITLIGDTITKAP